MTNLYLQKDFFRFLFTEIENKRSTDTKEADKLQDKFFSLIEKEFEHSTSIKGIENQVYQIKNRLDLFDKKSFERAVNFYKDFPENDISKKEIKKLLIDCFLRMDLAIKKEDFKVAAKNGIVQLEAFLEIFKDEVIQWVDDNNKVEFKNKIKTEKRGEQLYKKIAFNDSCYITGKYFNLYLDYKKINLLYNLRNFESHAFIGEQAIKANENLEILSNNYAEYFRELFIFIKELKNKIR